MKEQFCTYEISKSLKELGFKEDVLAYYTPERKLKYTDSNLSVQEVEWLLKAPLWQQAIDWFRKEYNLKIDIYDNTLEKKYAFSISELFSNTVIYSSGKWFAVDTINNRYYKKYEEAKEQAILKTIELIDTQMKKGDKTRIKKQSKVSSASIAKFFKDPMLVRQDTRFKIHKAIKTLGIDYKIPIKQEISKVHNDRYDIYNNLPHGAITMIAKKVGCSAPLVNNVLEGKREDHYGIIKEAELMAAINIWKTRFCKFKSQL